MYDFASVSILALGIVFSQHTKIPLLLVNGVKIRSLQVDLSQNGGSFVTHARINQSVLAQLAYKIKFWKACLG